eukprot:5537434-Lingulodinium_polyedra.AAC.1
MDRSAAHELDICGRCAGSTLQLLLPASRRSRKPSEATRQLSWKSAKNHGNFHEPRGAHEDQEFTNVSNNLAIFQKSWKLSWTKIMVTFMKPGPWSTPLTFAPDSAATVPRAAPSLRPRGASY